MQKNTSIAVALALTTGVVGATTIGTVKYIDGLKNELQVKTEQVEMLNSKNSVLLSQMKKEGAKQKEETKRLAKQLQNSKDKNIELTKTNKELNSEIEVLKKQVFPTQRIIARTVPRVQTISKTKKPKKIKGYKKKGTPIKIKMTFYGDFAHENGGYAGIDCNGDKLVAGTVASNYYPQGTQFEFNGQIFTVRDRGGSNFNNPNRLDVFVPRLNNESDSDYTKRIRHYGVKKVVMYKR